MFEYIDIKTAPAALGPYSQAVMAGNTILRLAQSESTLVR